MGQRRPHSPQHSNATPKPPDPDLQAIIRGTDVESARLLVETAQQWGAYLASERLTSAQIRGIFGQVRQIEMGWPSDVSEPGQASEFARMAERELILLKPKLAYQAQRDAEKNRNAPVRQLEQILSPAIDLVQGDRDNFQRFVDFFEAILAYHRSAGGK